MISYIPNILVGWYFAGQVFETIYPYEFLDHAEVDPENELMGDIVVKVNELKEKMGITKPIQVRAGHWYRSHGMNLLGGPAGMEIPIDLTKVQTIGKEEQAFTFKHELSHIKNNDRLRRHLLSAIAFVAGKTLFGFTGGVAAAFLTVCVVSRWREQQADLCDLNVLTPEEREGGVKSLQQALDFHKKWWKEEEKKPFYERYNPFRFFTDQTFGTRLTYPSDKTRLRNLKERIHTLSK